jgi:hypothetical protein
MANYRKSFNFRNGVQVDDDNFIVRSSGLVGIGTSQPSENLDISGSAKISGLTTTNSLFARNATIGVLTATTLNIANQSVENLLVTGITTLGNNVNSDLVTFNSKIDTNILPSGSGTLDLGSSTAAWNAIYANSYQNFAFDDLPTGTSEESTFAPDRLLKVKSDGSGYELVDILTLNSYLLSGLNISNDPTVYTGIGSTVSNKLQVSGISTVKFFVGEKVKVFGITTTSDSTFVSSPDITSTVTKVGSAAGVSTYRYWMAEYNLRNGKVGVASEFGSSVYAPALSNFNEENNITLSLKRSSTNNGILIYRQVGVTTNISQTKLIGILGPKELGSNLSNIAWTDYGNYDQVEWSTRGTVNEYTNQIHFPGIATTGNRRGWAIDTVEVVGENYIRLSGNYKTNVGFSGTDATVKVVHDNTYAFNQAISASISAGDKSINLPSGTFLANEIIIPSGFTLRGNGKNTIIKQQYFATDETDGGGNTLSLNGKLIGVGTTGTSDITIQDLTLDGNNQNNILLQTDSDNYIAYFDNVSSALFKSIEIRNSTGNGLYITNTQRVSVENSSFVDGCLSDREAFQPLNAQGSESLRINDCLFENYPGPVDLSVTSVVSTGGNIIRACGTGLRTYASGKITTSNNIILGPADEYIPTPDIYDSDYNSVNITIQRGLNFNGPVLLYLEDGSPKDLSSTKPVVLAAGIGTIVGQGTTNETLGTKFLNFNITTPDTGNNGINRQSGYVQLSLNSTQTNSLGLSSALGYDIIGTEYINPVGYSTYVGISSGVWNVIGAGATTYTVTLFDYTQFTGISTGDVVKLYDHSASPDLSAFELTVSQKVSVSSLIKQLVLTGFTTTSSQNGGLINGGASRNGYILIRNIFTIAKGRVGVI